MFHCNSSLWVLYRKRNKHFEKVIATTGEHPFFEPAQNMYQACGFQESKRGTGDECSQYGTITYEIRFEDGGSQLY